MHDLYILARELWLLWFMALFTGICIWAFWPGRKSRMEEHAQIPLRDGTPSHGRR